MQIQQLRYFLAVIDHGGFTRAATHLGRTQQAVSKSLRQLEAELGVRLLDRESSVPRPTAFGRQLADFARSVIRDEALLRQNLSPLTGEISGEIRIGASPTIAGHWVARAVQNLEALHPNIKVSVHNGLQDDFIAKLAADQLDLALYVRTRPASPGALGLLHETLGHETYRIIAGSGHPLAQAAGTVTVAQAAAARWALGSNSGDVEAAWREVFEAAGIAPPDAGCETDSIEFCRGLLAAGRHLSVLPVALVEREIAAGQLACLSAPQFEWQRPVILAYRDRPQSTAVLATIQALHEIGS
jgi:DNA-binding transcriptional LysR family regulator